MPDPTESDQATPTDRLRRALLRPSRRQVVAGLLMALVGFAAVTQVRITGTDDTFSGYRDQELIDLISALAGTQQRTEDEIDRLEGVAADLRDDTTKRQAALDQAESEVDTLTILAGLVPGQWLITHNVGATLSTVVAAPAPGAYWVAIQAIDGATNPVSNPVPVVVTSMSVPPAAPANFAVYFDRFNAHFAWAPGAGGGVPTGYVMQASLGGSVVANIPVTNTQISIPNVPAGQAFTVSRYGLVSKY